MMSGIGIAFIVCLGLAILSKRFGLPPIPFYIIAGLLLGSSGFAIVAPGEIAAFLTEAGLLFLLFTMGLELKPDQVRNRRGSFFLSGGIDLLVNLTLGLTAALLLGFDLFDALVIAAAFYISSSAMAVASLIENRKLILRESETVVWLMIFEDIVLVGFIILFSASNAAPVALILKIAVVVAGFLVLARVGSERLTTLLSRDDELPLLFTFGAVIGAALIATFLEIPATIVVIALGSALSTTAPASLEQHARPFRDVFLVIFFVFFGITVDLTGSIPVLPLVGLSMLALASKLLSGMLIGRKVHASTGAGIEIWANTAARGEFSIALAAVYGSPVVSGTVALLVVITSIAGAFMGKYSGRIKKTLKTRPPGF
jgi:CPA2 family monovalent cation:H+ antiporter-2